jgi:hypothetical protein
MYNTQNHWASGLCPSSGILNARKYVSETGSVSVLRCREGDTYSHGFVFHRLCYISSASVGFQPSMSRTFWFPVPFSFLSLLQPLWSSDQSF